MIKKFKIFEQFNEIDPYDEENWFEIDNPEDFLTKILKNIDPKKITINPKNQVHGHDFFCINYIFDTPVHEYKIKIYKFYVTDGIYYYVLKIDGKCITNVTSELLNDVFNMLKIIKEEKE